MEKLRSLFPVTEKFTFLNHAATSPVSLRVAAAIEEAARSFSNFGGLHYSKWMKRVEEVRTLAAGLLNARVDEIAFTGNTSEGLSIVASGIPWKQGDEVAISYPDFPANVYPWMNLERYGVKLHHIRRGKNGAIGLESLKKIATNKLRLVSVSSVDYATGFNCDLRELGDFCRNNEILLCVDGIQGLGVLPVDVKKTGIHFLASGCHKWLMSSPGTGILYISEDVADRLTPSKIGWKSVQNEEDFSIHFNLKPGARKFEPGTMNIAGIYALGAALELIHEVGTDNIRSRVFSLNDILYDELTKRNLDVISSMDTKHRSGILTFSTPGDPAELYRYLVEKRVIVSLRAGKIRISPHFYNNEKDVDRFLETLDEYLKIKKHRAFRY